MRTLVFNNTFCAMIARNTQFQHLTSLNALRQYYATHPKLWEPCNCPNGYKGIGAPEIPIDVYRAVTSHPNFVDDVRTIQRALKFERAVVNVGGFRPAV